MNKKLPWLLAFVAISFMACTTTPPHTPHTKEVKALLLSPKTAADHEAIAAHYEEDAKMLREKEEEHKKILSQYEREPWLYGKQAVGFGEHCKHLIQLYGQGADASLEMAKTHRAIADELKRQ